MPYTKTQIRQNLDSSKAWLERGIVAIYENGGFSETDADYLSYVAQWIQSGQKLNGKHVRQARALMMKYAERLAELANAQEPKPPSTKMEV